MPFAFRLLSHVKLLAEETHRSSLDDQTKRAAIADCLAFAIKVSPNIDEFNQDFARETIHALDTLAHQP